MKETWNAFWAWYDRHYVLNVSIALFLFALQLVHLFWLGGEVIAEKALGAPIFTLDGVWQLIILLVDYTEIPALFTVSLIYIDAWRHGKKWYAILMLALLHSQWIHIFWITDEFVVDSFTDHMHESVFPAWLAWVAILIDYLEVPVIIDTVRRLFAAIKEQKGLAGIKDALDEE